MTAMDLETAVDSARSKLSWLVLTQLESGLAPEGPPSSHPSPSPRLALLQTCRPLCESPCMVESSALVLVLA
jgi:hypothetical protein